MKKSTNTGLKPPSELQRKTRIRNTNFYRLLGVHSNFCALNLDLLTKEETSFYLEVKRNLSEIISNWRANNFEFGINSKIEVPDKESYKKVMRFLDSKEIYE